MSFQHSYPLISFIAVPAVRQWLGSAVSLTRIHRIYGTGQRKKGPRIDACQLSDEHGSRHHRDVVQCNGSAAPVLALCATSKPGRRQLLACCVTARRGLDFSHSRRTLSTAGRGGGRSRTTGVRHAQCAWRLCCPGRGGLSRFAHCRASCFAGRIRSICGWDADGHKLVLWWRWPNPHSTTR